MMIRKNVCTGIMTLLLMTMQGVYGAPNTVVGCVENPNGYTCGILAPGAIAITPNGKKAYVLNSSQTISVVDVATDTVIHCVKNYAGCPFFNLAAIAITPNGSKAYVCNGAGNSVIIIDVATDTAIGCVENNYGEYPNCPFNVPQAIAITPDGSRAYVCNGEFNLGGSVSIIDVATDTVIGCVENNYADYPNCPFFNPLAIAITHDGSKAYVCNGTGFSGNSVSVIDLTLPTPTVVKCVENTYGAGCAFDTPRAIAITPPGITPAKAYVCNTAGHSVSVIDVASDTVIGCVENTYGAGCAFNLPTAIAITPDGSTAYICNEVFGVINIMDVASNTVIGCVEPPNYPGCPFSFSFGIAITPDGTKAYITNNGSSSVSIIELLPPIPPVTILPPATVSGCKTKNIFLLQTDFINNITWTAPASGTAPVAYKIYRDPALTQLVATVPASGPLQYFDHDRNPGVVYSYFIVSVDGSGNVSTANSITVTQSCGLVRDVHSM